MDLPHPWSHNSVPSLSHRTHTQWACLHGSWKKVKYISQTEIVRNQNSSMLQSSIFFNLFVKTVKQFTLYIITAQFPIKLLSCTHFSVSLVRWLNAKWDYISTLGLIPDCHSAPIKSWFHNCSVIWQSYQSSDLKTTYVQWVQLHLHDFSVLWSLMEKVGVGRMPWTFPVQYSALWHQTYLSQSLNSPLKHVNWFKGKVVL